MEVYCFWGQNGITNPSSLLKSWRWLTGPVPHTPQKMELVPSMCVFPSLTCGFAVSLTAFQIQCWTLGIPYSLCLAKAMATFPTLLVLMPSLAR